MTSDTLHLLLLYAFTDLIACLTPGPAVLTVASHALAGSRRGAAGAITGINAGNLIWFVLAGAGLSAVVMALPNLFAALRWIGIGYLIWIGVQAWRQSDEKLALKAAPEKAGFRRGLLSAAAVQLSNPKALLFFTVILPPFISPTQPIVPQIAALALIAVTIEAAVLVVYATLAWRLGRYTANRATNRLVNRTSGTLLIVAALGIAATGKVKP
ncbi:LysE family translocator [Sphingobium sufflavum]|uniref:LysE family translocator n=1 Tax=Sphingobium sufflavum TaxID=1129547 RepID=UPI001F43DB19|nr:LysE family translocator [Sphingobium sufflavum]MCE7797041.1 LysE family translocator [Sphingobium sufflavum]